MNRITLDQALQANGETDTVEFKQGFNVAAIGECLELVKDIVAIANSGGGWILVGLLDNGFPVGIKASTNSADPAVLADKVYGYTGIHLKGLKVAACIKQEKQVVAIEIPSAEYPIIFIKVGNYTTEDKRTKSAFSQGTVYFRHSAKSEPGTADDLRHFVDAKLETTRKFWMDGIAQVVHAPTDSLVAVLPSEVRLSNAPDAAAVSITPELAAKMLQAPMVDHTHPYRQKEVIEAFNKRVKGKVQINSHHLLCVRRAHQIHRDIKYCYNMNWSSPRYSPAFVDWLMEQYNADKKFFDKAKRKADKLRREKKSNSE